MVQLKQSHKERVHMICTRIAIREPLLRGEMIALQKTFCEKKSLAFFFLNRKDEDSLTSILGGVLKKTAFIEARSASMQDYRSFSTCLEAGFRAGAFLRVARHFEDYIAPIQPCTCESSPTPPVGA
jgi:hypothetical protein